MNAPNDVPFTQWAAIHATEKFFIVTPLSGYRRQLPEDELYSIYLEPGATEATLGQAVLEALAKSASSILAPIAASSRWIGSLRPISDGTRSL